jgi:hypothetical protein
MYFAGTGVVSNSAGRGKNFQKSKKLRSFSTWDFRVFF